MAKTKHTMAKRQRELGKKQKKQEKAQRQLSRKQNKNQLNELDDAYPKMVISPDFGIGKVTGIDCPNNDDVQYFVVEYGMRITGYFPVKGNRPFRFLASQATISQALQQLTKPVEKKTFADRKDQVAYYKELAQVQDAMSIAQAIGKFRANDDLGVLELKLMEKLIDSLTLEISIVLEEELDDAKKRIDEHLKPTRPKGRINAATT